MSSRSRLSVGGSVGDARSSASVRPHCLHAVPVHYRELVLGGNVRPLSDFHGDGRGTGSVSPWLQRSSVAVVTFSAQSSVNKVEVAHSRLPRVGFRSWSRFLAVSLQVTWVINPVVGCHYFPPGLQLRPQPLRGLLPILLLDEQRHDGCEQFA